jgi:hypothetical protein
MMVGLQEKNPFFPPFVNVIPPLSFFFLRLSQLLLPFLGYIYILHRYKGALLYVGGNAAGHVQTTLFASLLI